MEIRRRSLGLAAASGTLVLIGVASLGLASTGAAQSATGSITGRVVWCPRIIGPVPFEPDSGTAPDEAVPPPAPAPAPESVQPDQSGSPSGIVPVRPPFPRVIPAGAVLVAAQGTGVSTRTDESGRFTLAGIPAGQYLTVAAGPVSSVGNTFAVRPNAFVQGGQSQDLGTLTLGSCGLVGIRAAEAAEDAAP